MNSPETRTLPQISRKKGDQGLGHTAVIVLAHGEPETYDPSAWIKQIKEFDEQKIAFIPYPFRPFFFHALREKYLMAGKSGHNFECLQIMRQMEAEYRKKGDLKTKFYISYLENEPHPDTAVIQALNEGASNIIICNIFVTISSHTQEAINMIKPLNPKDYCVTVSYSKPLYDSKTLQQRYVDAVNANTKNSDKKSVGVILVGHGQPLEWDKEFYTQTQQETSFRKDILNKLELEGYSSQNLKLAWMEFRDPKPKAAVMELIQNGSKEIFYFSTIIGSESIHAKYDVPDLIHKIRVPNTVRIQQLTAFEDQSGIVKALMERIEECR
jgi:protoheme ferro-lyase